ncbi:hypothetical protein EYZ11_009756 [Aspergillus tanneri]|uniref:SWIM-type domain-containing protein n=1 Tax=Aspergillus tanneri TaxID=1220188 RepID=A0A4S3J959_9EURO|nr:uncharacterized protein ATNIH1004_006208 [Aspergillus tanneri]KAA8647515.1 hypothetical protein ATNIH1004_006208 [Aspergillus tanneri]THC90778.1 hypothetical protein EYZ11_009756 [Aspergillus tanneri]
MENRDDHIALPSFPSFIERLISQLSQYAGATDGQTQTSSAGPLLPELKPLMLTLHCFFPNELLLALDILDRGLVRRIATQLPTQEDLDPSTDPPNISTFFVISASTAPPASTRAVETKGYEVRLQAWNCTCPALTIATFRNSHSSQSGDGDGGGAGYDVVLGEGSPSYYPFGGALTWESSTRMSPPVCKHLLACLLMVRCPGVFAAASKAASLISVSAEELAGWCAGWRG